ncbi:oxygenase MpaB family protein [Emcibacter sp. SYSU 3D8]|uniref:oxygenase MpaB family protein n=1 Tax=Emcibacter sp. SYSU 3D8 TaxID=3133969 RepID=UPI0031FED1C1
MPGTARVMLPLALSRRLDTAASALLRSESHAIDFAQPAGEPALVAADSVSWRIFKNPITMFIGGVAAVILELAEPSVRSGVWEHSGFRGDPVRRLRRTGLAAMVTVYGARSVAQTMIAGVRRMHARVHGETASGVRYRAADADLLTWVQATASFGFAEAWSRYVQPLSKDELDRYYAEGDAAARLYGAVDAPMSDAERAALFDAMHGRLEASPILFEFLEIMGRAPIFPAPFRPAQRLLVRAAVDITPRRVRDLLGLDRDQGLVPWQAPLVRRAAQFSERMMLASSPAVQSCLRLGLPADFLYRRGAA